jgi:outer membrane protein
MALVLSFLWTVSMEAQTTRVGYINSEAVLAEYGPAQEAQQALETARGEAESELQLLNSGLQAAAEEYQQQAMSMTDQARQIREQELNSQQQAVGRRSQELEIQFQQRQAELLQPVMEGITAVIEEIRVEGNYALILDTASQVILAADPALDLTQEVLVRLQAANPPEGGQ